MGRTYWIQQGNPGRFSIRDTYEKCLNLHDRARCQFNTPEAHVGILSPYVGVFIPHHVWTWAIVFKVAVEDRGGWSLFIGTTTTS